ncbi:germinal-center associated nuclear protein [Arapaima gigas]
MNSSNLFGNPQAGAFQVPGGTDRGTGLVSFGQTGSGASFLAFRQPTSFGQPPAFGQPTASGQGSVLRQPVAISSGQSSAFGLSPGLSTQTPTFGQQALGQGSTGFSAPLCGTSQSATFGQFGQTQSTSAFGVSASISQSPAGLTAVSGSSKPLGFGQPSFGQPSMFLAPGSSFQSSAFVTSKSNFKPSESAVFKPIFSVSPEPSNTQVGVGSELPSSAQPIATNLGSSRSSSGFSPLSKTSTGIQGFNFSQPAPAPLMSAQSGNSLPAKDVLPGSNLQFIFSQPATPVGSGGGALSGGVSQEAPEPNSSSSFNFTPSTLQPSTQSTRPLFGGFSQAAAGSREKGADGKSFGEVAFGSLGKGTKRKEETTEQATVQGQAAEDSSQTRADAPRLSSKRPLNKSRGPSCLFRNALSSLMKSTALSAKQESKKEEEQQSEWAEHEKPDVTPPASTPPISHTLTTAPRSHPSIKEVAKRAEETADPDSETRTPVRRIQREESTDSLVGLSPSDATVIQCKNIPSNLFGKDILRTHFSRFGKVHRIFCRPQKNLAIVHFQDHASAARAKKRGKLLHRQEIAIFWQKKKPRLEEKDEKPAADQDLKSEEENNSLSTFHSSPLRKALSRTSASSSSSNSSSITKSSPVKKPQIVKSLQFETEPQKDSSPEPHSFDRATSAVPLPSSLLHLVGQVAETAEDKYRLLEQRDKILRQGRSRRTELHLSKVFVGTCPDMCPEKERYMRETRNQLSSFEVIPNTEKVDHTAAIKEYSRSSADQEEPLPHELRPLPVLSMTMDYLVTQIMDQGEDNFRDWYDFVWNRTRGIRKDITQQHLCDPLTVSLIEKCARFHIHCAHHLCQEPMMSFDAKINNENLTKCLQSLKEMYQDLATRGVYCPHEAEFRQYSVLLKLNDGDILREVQQFRAEVRNSPEVNFAVQAFAAINNNNFVRFFKLVKAASYLSGCILHRYFNQVRSLALRNLNTAYTVGSRGSTHFPLDDLVRMLMFHSVTEAGDFVQQYGLSVESEMVELSRTVYQDPELPLPPKRSMAIMSKRTVLIGQVVNGGPLPSLPQHTPVCSFDSRHKYRGEALLHDHPKQAVASPQRQEVKLHPEIRPLMELDVRPPFRQKPPANPTLFAEPQTLMEAPKTLGAVRSSEPSTAVPLHENQPLFLPPPQCQLSRPPSPPPSKPEPIYNDQDLAAEVQSVVDEVVQAECAEMATDAADYVSVALNACNVQLETVLSEVLEQVLWEVSTTEIQAEKERIAEEKRKIEEARRKQEHEAFLAEFSMSLCSEITQEVLQECIAKTAAAEIRHAQEEKAACVARSSEEVCCSLLEETLQGELNAMAREILDMELQRIHKFLRRWRDVVAVRRQLKRQMRSFPAAPCCVDPRFKLQALAPSAPSTPCLEQLAHGVVSLGHGGNVTLSCTRSLKMRQEALYRMKVHYYFEQLLSDSVWTPLDLPSLVVENIPNPGDRIFWKAVLLLPSDHESDASMANRILTDWLESKFCYGGELDNLDTGSGGHIQTLSISQGLRSLGDTTHQVHVCIKVAHGPLSTDGQAALEKRKDLMGTNALLMLLPTMSAPEEEGEEDEEDVFLLSALLQLKQLQQASTWTQPLPLALVVPGQADRWVRDNRLEKDLKLKMLVEDGLISEYVVVHIPETTNDLQGSKQVSQVVKWLASHSPAPIQLISQTLVHFVEVGLCQEFTARLHHDRQERNSAGLPPQEPTPIIQLYNATLDFLAGLISSPELATLSWPIAEFTSPGGRDLLPHLEWNSPEHLQWLRRAVLCLQLPEWDLPPPSASWAHLVASIFQYASQVPSSRCSQPLLMSQLENLLEKVQSDTEWNQSPGLHNDEMAPHFCQLPWDEIVTLCIDHKLKEWKPLGNPPSKEAISDDGVIMVYFPKDHLGQFIPPSCWVEAEKQTHRDKLLKAQSNCISQPHVTPLHVQKKLFHSLVEKSDLSILHASVDVTHTATSEEQVPHRVLASIEQEKAQSQRFEEQLQHWLKMDPLDSFTMPLFVPSTLLSVPEIMVASPKTPPSSPAKPVWVEKDPGVHGDEAQPNRPKRTRVSMAQRLQKLEQLISASREEELACQLKLSSLLDIVED